MIRRQINIHAAFKASLAAGDLAVMAFAFMGAYWLRYRLPGLPPPPPGDFWTYARFSVFIAFAGFVTLYSAGLYRLQQPFFGVDDFFSIIKAVTVSHLIAAAMGFAVRGRLPGDAVETFSRIVLATSWLSAIFLLTLWRLGADITLTSLRRRGIGLSRVLIVGGDDFGRSFHDMLAHNPELGLEPVGLVNEGELSKVEKGLAQTKVHEVMMATRETESETVMAVMALCQQWAVRFSMVPTMFHVMTSRIQVREIAGVPVFGMDERIFLRSSRILKRSIDLVISTAALVVAAPIAGLVALLVKLESRGPAVLRQTRVGKGARPFTVYKLRSMRADAEALKTQLADQNEQRGPLFKIRRDPRITRVGRVIRKLSIDEIPQLVNVLRGEMSMVGPRPPLPSEVDQYAPWQRKRFEALPGITGLAQISGRSDLSFDETLRFDFFYIENWSPLMDLKILLKTVPRVLAGKGAY